jgi:AhpD family alkylhydroperoxidase
MPRIPAHNLDTAPPAIHDTLKALQQRYGKIFNVHAGMAHSPIVLAAYTALDAAIAEHATFDAPTQEAIALAVAAADRCDYCQAAHTGGAVKAGLVLQTTVAIRAGQPVEAKLDALLAVARQAATDIGKVDEATWQHALNAGWTLEQLTELFAHLVLNIFTNYFNHYAHTELDLPPAPE